MLLALLTTEAVPKDTRITNRRYESLIAQIAQGEISALATLYAETKTAVYGFALSILKNPQNAEDVMQDTYIRIYQAAAGYQPQGKPLAWILTIVRNLAFMKLRQKNNHELPLDWEWPEEAGGNFAQTSADRLTLKAALTLLSDPERQIIFLHALAGLKHREIASLLDIPLSTVLNKYQRALAKLKNHLGREDA